MVAEDHSCRNIFLLFLLYRAVQCVPFPEDWSKYEMPHSFLFGLLGNLSLTNIPVNKDVCSFFTNSISYKLDKRMLGKGPPFFKHQADGLTKSKSNA